MDILNKYNIYDYEYYTCIKDIINHKVVLSMDNYIQHGNITTLEHSVHVSYESYKLAKKLNLNFRELARGALLHDMFLYDWHDNLPKTSFFKQHGFIHPTTALNNAKKYFTLTKREENIIKCHMWPLTIRTFPKYIESLIIVYTDKSCALKETAVGIKNIITNIIG